MLQRVSCLGEVLVGPILSSLQSAGAIPAVSQPRGLAGFPANVPPSVQAGPGHFAQWPGIQFPGAGGYPAVYHPGDTPLMHHPRRSVLQGECSNASLSVTPSLSDQGPIDSEVLDDQVSIHPGYDEETHSVRNWPPF